jgi:UDP-N-acetylglucosamine:LPS N-acetylglucosamine transferase
MKRLKICIVASAGGHLSQLLKLVDSWNGYETFSITTTKVVREKLQKFSPVYTVGECNRQHPILVFKVLLQCIRVILKERPDVIISTGAAVGCIACFLGKFIGAKIVWLDSITNVEKLSLSGQMVRFIADLFLVQWPELAQKYSNVEYIGSVI